MFGFAKKKKKEMKKRKNASFLKEIIDNQLDEIQE